ncbi:hypothetical protein NLJ89_g10695 [Agrocybe chaxingu]|uniref:Uncharacterized protein n=1 Tax=Agrocybe chaxingu TaxID=84603 RepID=A0A9W8JXN0_9AGAR|nr:hypothetical protein NLJ89_g10695 [Agrocybe chaxingu]
MSSSHSTPTTKVTHILSTLKNAAGPQEREGIRTVVRKALTEGRLDGETVALLLSSSDFLAQPRAGKVDAISKQAEALIEASKQKQTRIKEPTFQDVRFFLNASLNGLI